MGNNSLANHNPEDRHQGHLEHIGDVTERALYPVIKLRICAACRGKFRGKDLFEVGNDHLIFFEGDKLCRSCARGHAIL